MGAILKIIINMVKMVCRMSILYIYGSLLLDVVYNIDDI